jgi:hypothetical protein
VQPPVLGRQARRTRKYGTFQTNNRHQLLSLRAPPGFPGDIYLICATNFFNFFCYGSFSC